jgi:hypothetical protein
MNLFPGAQALLRGNPNEMNDDLSLDDQIEILPYDRRWEFPRNRLKLGMLNAKISRRMSNICH